MENDRPRQFGTPLAGTTYADRPGSYAVAVIEGRVLVVETPTGWFLPGGGVTGNETPEETLRREVDEETGYGIVALRRLGSARQIVGGGINKVETFFIVDLTGQDVAQAEPEPDHRPRWVSVEEAILGLREEAQVWALTAAFGATGR
ncbi:MAG: NUDIX domain-containing protein [Chloroflexota bacterium]|nr:NUDIX domain-containing protein [Chloroflexota bacterium]